MEVNGYPHGPKVINVSDILFVRRRIPPIELPTDAPAKGKVQTKFDFVYTIETAEELRDLANAERAKPLSFLSTAIKWPVYFAGELASGPLQLMKSEIRDGVQSAFLIGKFGIRVSNTPQEVFDVIQKAGGQTREILPPIDNTTWAQAHHDFEWDIRPPIE
ncbi:hypothetical protein [Rhizobium sp. NPDC090279]|uniref:hypothetical protein n=1 Tax=Rhizobium sp. NPDC090279 TaxID=3364499 RepID=UPI00383A3BED